MNFSEVYEQKIKEAEEIVFSYLPKEEGYQKTVIQAMRYSIMAGGKRLRPVFMKEVYLLFGGSGRVIEPFMAALEMIHNYSLVHDDLPCMDNDEYRRGQKTTHIVYGEGMAVLTGDALLNYAFETALEAFDIETENKNIKRALKILTGKAGLYGMLGGQVVDVEKEKANEPMDINELTFVHEYKTGALIESAMMIGAVLAGAEECRIRQVEEAARLIGVAFQIQDDILDVEGNQEILGKPVGSDEKNHKTTYVTLRGLDRAKQDVKEMSERAISIFREMPVQNEFLNQLIESLVGREK